MRRRRSHPRKFTQSRGVARKLAIKSLHDIHRRPMQRKRTTVVSHTLPSSQNIGNGRLSQGSNSGKALEPRRPSIANAHHLRLLQHHLRKPDAVWIARAAPREVAIQTDPFRSHKLTKGVCIHLYLLLIRAEKKQASPMRGDGTFRRTKRTRQTIRGWQTWHPLPEQACPEPRRQASQSQGNRP